MNQTEKKKKILDETDGGLVIFRAILPDLPENPKKLFRSHLRDESVASAHLHLYSDGVWLYKDFNNGNGLNVIDFIAKYKSVPFAEALKMAADYGNISISSARQKKIEITTIYPNTEQVEKTLRDTNTNFHAFCISMGIGNAHLEKWGVGGDENGKTVFVYRDAAQKVRNLKYFSYLPSGKRDKDKYPFSLQHKSDTEQYSMCFYGEHLLSGRQDSTVCIVESEKTAVIASWFYPDYEWLATGGISGAKKNDYARVNLADGRRCLVIIDADPVRKIPKAVAELQALGANVNTVDLFPDRKDKTDIADYIYEGLTPEIVEDKVSIFWKVNEKGKYEILASRYGMFLEQNNFSKIYPDGSNFPTLVKISGRFIEETSTKRIQDYVLQYLRNGPFGEDAHSFFFNNPGFFAENYISGISTSTVQFHEDTADTAYLYYLNCAVRIKANGPEMIPYSSLNGYVWKSHVLQRNYNPDVKTSGEYERFIYLVGAKDPDKISAFRSAIGYMLHGYKTLAKAKAVILNDEKIGSSPNGGSGKGIFCQALSHMKRLVKLDAKAFNPMSQFSFQSVTQQTQIVLFNDAKETFDFESLFNVITDSFRIERKNKDEIIIPHEKSPKVIISTNYAIKGSGPSHNRRRFELELSSHFSDHYTAFDEFGHELFRDWTEEEWARFDNFMIGCIYQFLREGLTADKSHNLSLKKLHSASGPEFVEWAQEGNLPPNQRLMRSDLFKSFTTEYSDQAKYTSQRAFKRYLEAYAEYAEYEIQEGNTMGRWIELKPIRQESIKQEQTKPELPDEPPF